MNLAAVGAVLVGALWVQTAPPATGRARIMFTEHGKPTTTAVRGSVYFEAPGIGVRERRVTSFARPVEIASMPPGVYRFTVVAQSLTTALVASQVHEVRIAGRDTVDVTIDLVTRDGWVTVVDATGAPVAGAHYFTRPSAVNSTADDRGRINLATIASGTELTVRTIQWGVTCHRITDAARQTVVVPDATEALVITAPPTPTSGLPQRRHILPSLRLAGAMVSGVPGSDCAVPYEHLPVTLARGAGVTVHTLLLPFGDYTLTLLDGTVLRASAPGQIGIR